MTAEFNVSIRMIVEVAGPNKGHLISLDSFLNTVGDLDHSAYFDEKGLPNAKGWNVIATTLTMGLVAAIHKGHAEGWKDSAAHLRQIIAELERGFVEVMTIEDIIPPAYHSTKSRAELDAIHKLLTDILAGYALQNLSEDFLLSLKHYREAIGWTTCRDSGQSMQERLEQLFESTRGMKAKL